MTRSSSAGDHGFVPCGIDLVINWCKKSEGGGKPYCFPTFFHRCLNDPTFPHAYYLCITRARTLEDPLKRQMIRLMYNFFVVQKELFLERRKESCNICEISEKLS